MNKRLDSLTTLPLALDRVRIIGTKQAAEALGFSVAHLRRLYRAGKLPKPVRIAGRKLGWSAGSLVDLIASASHGEKQ